MYNAEESTNVIKYCKFNDPKLNKCPFFDGKDLCLSENTLCGMQVIRDNRKNGYVRQKRWYEEYQDRSQKSKKPICSPGKGIMPFK